ncbi:MAG: GyrI-like domain-containing protein [Bacteroidota bacterium]
MNLQPRIELKAEKKLVGKHITMSFIDNKTFGLWSSFMPGRKEIINNIGSELYSSEVFPMNHFVNFNPENEFEKWAAVEVTDFNNVPEGMDTLTSPEGLYAVFTYKGPASEGTKAYHYIFMEWLPKSDYEVDERPHFAVMGEKYKHDDPENEEELWLPIRVKQ